MKKEACNHSFTLRVCGIGSIGSKGQIVIPKDVRDTMGLKVGDSMSFILKDEKVLAMIPNSSIDMLMEYLQSEQDTITLIQ